MSYVETTINDVKVIMQSYAFDQGGFTDTDSSEIPEKLTNMFENAAKVIDGIASQISSKMNKHSPDRPDELKVGFSIGATTEANVFVIKGSGELTIDIEMTWKKNKGE